MSNLLSGFIGAVVGALIGVGATILGLYLNYSIDFALDNEASVLELKSAKSIAESLMEEEVQIPKYQLLNMDIDWKKVLLDIGDDESEKLYFELKKLDTLRLLIIDSEDNELQEKYILDYRRILNDLLDTRLFDNVIDKFTRKNEARFKSNSQIGSALLQE